MSDAIPAGICITPGAMGDTIPAGICITSGAVDAIPAGISITPGAMVLDDDFLQEVEISEYLKRMAAGASWLQAYAQAQAPGARPGPGPGTGRRVRGPGPGTGRACLETGRAGEIPPKEVTLRGYLKRYGKRYGKKIYWVR